MAETFTKWDVIEHLGTKEDVRLYLEEDPGDGSLIRAALNDVARASRGNGGGRCGCDGVSIPRCRFAPAPLRFSKGAITLT